MLMCHRTEVIIVWRDGQVYPDLNMAHSKTSHGLCLIFLIAVIKYCEKKTTEGGKDLVQECSLSSQWESQNGRSWPHDIHNQEVGSKECMFNLPSPPT